LRIKRFISVLAVAAVMAVTMVATAVPAFAAPKNIGQCHKSLNQGNFVQFPNLPQTNREFNEAFNPPFTNCPEAN
jgi:hypothetical protein